MDDRWYNWRVQNWGTKWDAYSLEIDECDMPHGFEVNFETAWSPPEEICNAIREQYDDLSISYGNQESSTNVSGAKTIEAQSLQLSYSVGGASIKVAETQVDNQNYVSGTNREGRTIAVTLAF